MKKILLFMLAVSLGFAAVSCKDRGQVDTKNAPEFDFRKIKWGMNRAEVMETEVAKPSGEKADIVTYRDEFDGIPVIVGYLFDGDIVTRAGYLMLGSYDVPNKYIEDYEKIKISMIEKYGAPARDEMRWSEGQESQDPTQYGKAACDGKLVYVTIWSDGITMIKETLRGEEGKCRHYLKFESIDLYLNKTVQQDTVAVPSPGP